MRLSLLWQRSFSSCRWIWMFLLAVYIQEILASSPKNGTTESSSDHEDEDNHGRVSITFTNDQIYIVIGIVLTLYLIGYFLILFAAGGFDLIDEDQVKFRVTAQTARKPGERHVTKLKEKTVKKNN
uniref:Cnidarian restricted protein n=1 Tax=Clytia hemisphaerica TaxID=252671 RepID=A0A7M5V6J8_9CNID|eukprot:TCONS_00003569-protein